MMVNTRLKIKLLYLVIDLRATKHIRFVMILTMLLLVINSVIIALQIKNCFEKLMGFLFFFKYLFGSVQNHFMFVCVCVCNLASTACQSGHKINVHTYTHTHAYESLTRLFFR